ncbi:MAG TPA: phosphatidylinositol-specific phospholipase C/glycerophosphodiester phosphodiesterase family protein [Puia sp.]
MRKIFVPLFTFCLYAATAQPVKYTIANTHSHNDYEQHTPFWLAYNEGFGSIEADIFLENGKLLVGHDTLEIRSGRTLEEFYARTLLSCVRKNNGYPFADTARQLQMLIDIKTDSVATLDTLIGLLKRYPLLIDNPSIKWVITGNRPDPLRWASYPSFIWFDGILYRNYNREALSRIVMMSDDFKYYSHWNGKSEIPVDDRRRLEEAVTKSHRLGKPVRFWDAPDFINAWNQLMKLQVDYINTDHIHEMGDFLKRQPAVGL